MKRVRFVDVKIEGLERIMDSVERMHYNKSKKMKKYLEKLSGNFLVLGDKMIPFVKLPFVKYNKAEIQTYNESGKLGSLFDSEFLESLSKNRCFDLIYSDSSKLNHSVYFFDSIGKISKKKVGSLYDHYPLAHYFSLEANGYYDSEEVDRRFNEPIKLP